jgi:hypothetical protein
MRIKSRLEKLEGRQSEKGLADRLAYARLRRTEKPPPTASELEARARHKPESMAARIARGRLRIMDYDARLDNIGTTQ